jgi:hypothetical protein
MGSEVSEKLKQLWLVLNEGIKPDIIEKWWNKIEDEYRDNKSRKHYDLNHIAKMFIHLNENQVQSVHFSSSSFQPFYIITNFIQTKLFICSKFSIIFFIDMQLELYCFRYQ